MKKTLIALAALSATGAFAQSVTFDGIFDAGYQSLNYKGAKVSGFAGNGSSTSQLNIRGSQDLGNGMKAEFRVETDWNTTSNTGNSTAFGNGEVRGGVSGAFGRVDVGAVNNAQLDALLAGQPFGTAIGSSYKALIAADASVSVVRFDNSLRYLSPSFNGISGSLLKVNKQTKASGTANNGALGQFDYNGVTEFSLRYNGNGIGAIFASTKQDSNEVGSGTTTAKVTSLAANYAVSPALKVFLFNQKITKSDNSVDRGMTSLSATYAMGPHTFMAQLGKAKNNVNDMTSSLRSLGYDYALAAKTTLYVRYENIGDDAGLVANPGTLTATAGETTRNRTALGARIAF